MSLRPILEVCDRETGYEGGERLKNNKICILNNLFTLLIVNICKSNNFILILIFFMPEQFHEPPVHSKHGDIID